MIKIQKFTFNPFQENTYLLFDETKECIIIDPGCYENRARKLKISSQENELNPSSSSIRIAILIMYWAIDLWLKHGGLT